MASDPEDEERHILAPIKMNLAKMPPALAYRLVEAPAFGVAKVVWEGATAHSATALLAAAEAGRAAPALSPRAQAEGFLPELLAEGPVEAARIERLATSLGISYKTFKRAKAALRIVSEPVGRQDGGRGLKRWYWSLPDAPCLLPRLSP